MPRGDNTLVVHSKYETIGSIVVNFFPNHRNMTVVVPNINLTIFHRYIGHPNLSEDYGGVSTLFDPKVVKELACFPPSKGGSCTIPSVILMNSGHHDARGGIEKFSLFIKKVMSKLKLAQDAGCVVVWRGTHFVSNPTKLSPPTSSSIHTLLQSMDAVARSTAAQHHVPYFEISDILSDTSIPHSNRTKDHVHVGAIAKYSLGNDTNIILSSMITQKTLNVLCKSIQRFRASRHTSTSLSVNINPILFLSAALLVGIALYVHNKQYRIKGRRWAVLV